jgi:hypothetical protein
MGKLWIALARAADRTNYEGGVVLRKVPVALASAALLAGCAQATPAPIPVAQVVYITGTSVPTSTPLPTSTPTSTPAPTRAVPPTAVPSPTPKPVSIDALEAALKDAGYKRSPFYDEKGQLTFSWMKYSDYEWLTIWPDGSIRLSILDVRSLDMRKERMERQLKVLDSVFPPEFMTSLRQENDTYNASARTSVSGEPDRMYPPAAGDPWSSEQGRYNTSGATIASYPVTFALWFEQLTCPPQYSCYMTDFPGQNFTGDTSFVFYTIEISTQRITGGGSNLG